MACPDKFLYIQFLLALWSYYDHLSHRNCTGHFLIVWSSVVLEASIHHNPQPQNHTRILWDCGMTHWVSQSNATVFAKRPSSKHSACRKEHAAWLSESKASASALWDFSCLMNRHAQAFLEGRVFDVTSGGLALKYWQLHLHLHLLTARVFELKSKSFSTNVPKFKKMFKYSSCKCNPWLEFGIIKPAGKSVSSLLFLISWFAHRKASLFSLAHCSSFTVCDWTMEFLRSHVIS